MLSKPKPPRRNVKVQPRKGLVVEDKQSFMYKLKVKKNAILNKYYYAFLERNTPKFIKWLNETIVTTINYIRIAIWGVILLSVFRLLGYDFNLLNYSSCIAFILILKPIKKFIYKIMRLE